MAGRSGSRRQESRPLVHRLRAESDQVEMGAERSLDTPRALRLQAYQTRRRVVDIRRLRPAHERRPVFTTTANVRDDTTSVVDEMLPTARGSEQGPKGLSPVHCRAGLHTPQRGIREDPTSRVGSEPVPPHPTRRPDKRVNSIHPRTRYRRIAVQHHLPADTPLVLSERVYKRPVTSRTIKTRKMIPPIPSPPPRP